jgi:hypothetical protein
VTLENISRLIDHHEAEALADIVAAMPASAARHFGARTEVIDGATSVMIPATQTAYFNRVVGLGVREPATKRSVKRIVDLFCGLGCAYMVHVSPLARPEELPLWLKECGLEQDEDWVTIYRRREPIKQTPAQELIVRPLGPDQGRLFAELLCTGYGMPDEWWPLFVGLAGRRRWENFLLYEGSAAIGTGSLFVDDGVARLCNGSVLPGRRRRGAHIELLRYRLQLGLDTGCRLFTGETWKGDENRENPARRSHAHFDISTAYVRRNYIARPD